MYIEELKLINYRNYADLYIEFNKGVNLLIGKNGQGKTNMVEAITLMSIGRSFRTNKDRELIKFGSENLYCALVFLKNGIKKKIEIVITHDKKGVKINGVGIKSIGDLIGNLNVVVFSPEDLKLVKDGPKERRSFLDKEISQIMPRYYNILKSYNKVMMERNNILKSGNIDDNLLDVYDENMAKYASQIYKIRSNFVSILSDISRELHYNLTKGVEELNLVYKTQLGKVDFTDEKALREEFLKKTTSNRDLDILRKSTKYGPHRDDIEIFINGLDARNFASQGQQRTASIALKLSEIEIIKREIGEYPVLILDDIFSELDQGRQKMIIERLGDVQLFVTSADPIHQNIAKESDCTIFEIDSGRVSKIGNGGK